MNVVSKRRILRRTEMGDQTKITTLKFQNSGNRQLLLMQEVGS